MPGYNVWDTINCSISLTCRIACSDKFKVTAEREICCHQTANITGLLQLHHMGVHKVVSVSTLYHGAVYYLSWADDHARQGWEVQFLPPPSSFSLLLPLSPVNSPLDYLEVHQATVFGIHLRKLCPTQL